MDCCVAQPGLTYITAAAPPLPSGSQLESVMTIIDFPIRPSLPRSSIALSALSYLLSHRARSRQPFPLPLSLSLSLSLSIAVRARERERERSRVYSSRQPTPAPWLSSRFSLHFSPPLYFIINFMPRERERAQIAGDISFPGKINRRGLSKLMVLSGGENPRECGFPAARRAATAATTTTAAALLLPGA